MANKVVLIQARSMFDDHLEVEYSPEGFPRCDPDKTIRLVVSDDCRECGGVIDLTEEMAGKLAHTLKTIGVR